MANNNFVDVMEGREQPSLKAIALIFGVQPQRIYSIAKQPLAGQMYDPKVYNWDAISKFIEKRIGKEGDIFSTMEEAYDAAIAQDEDLATSDKRKGARTGGSSKALIDLGDGKTMPARRRAVAIGDTCHFKSVDIGLEVVYLTDTHVVFKDPNSTALTCLSNWTFNQKLINAPKVELVADADGE